MYNNKLPLHFAWENYSQLKKGREVNFSILRLAEKGMRGNKLTFDWIENGREMNIINNDCCACGFFFELTWMSGSACAYLD